MRLKATWIFNLRIFLQEKSHEANSCFEHQEVSNRTKGWIRISLIQLIDAYGNTTQTRSMEAAQLFCLASRSLIPLAFFNI